MNLDLGEGEPRGAEHIRRVSGRRGRSTSWTRWAAGSGWTWITLLACWAALAWFTGWTWLTGLSFIAILAGYSWSATRTRLSRHPRRASGTGGTRASGLTLNARRADVALLAVRSRLSRPVYTGRTRRTGRPRRASRTRWADDSLARPRRKRGDDAVDDRPGEGQDG